MLSLTIKPYDTSVFNVLDGGKNGTGKENY